MLEQIQQAVTSILPRLYEDGNLTRDITYRVFNGTSFDTDKGYNVEQWTSYSVKAIPLEAALTGRKVSPVAFSAVNTALQRGNTVFMFRTADLPDKVSLRDTIVDDITTYNIFKITPVFGIITLVEVVSNA